MTASKKLLSTAALAGVVAAAVLTVGADKANAGKKGMEKCKGIVKAGKNDCGANGHSCAGQAAVDNDPNEWIYMPKGLCDKIVGGEVKMKKKS